MDTMSPASQKLQSIIKEYSEGIDHAVKELEAELATLAAEAGDGKNQTHGHAE
jgi:hypothetical protein